MEGGVKVKFEEDALAAGRNGDGGDAGAIRRRSGERGVAGIVIECGTRFYSVCEVGKLGIILYDARHIAADTHHKIHILGEAVEGGCQHIHTRFTGLEGGAHFGEGTTRPQIVPLHTITEGRGIDCIVVDARDGVSRYGIGQHNG